MKREVPVSAVIAACVLALALVGGLSYFWTRQSAPRPAGLGPGETAEAARQLPQQTAGGAGAGSPDGVGGLGGSLGNGGGAPVQATSSAGTGSLGQAP